MKRMIWLLGVAMAACSPGTPEGSRPAQPDGADAAAIPFLTDGIGVSEMDRRVAQFAPAVLDIDDSTLQPWEKQVLKKLVDASVVLHEIYALQVHEQVPLWRARLEAEQGEGKARAIEYFELMVGPWDRLEHDQPFLEVGPKPAGAAFYPLDMTKEEFEGHLARNPKDKTAFTGYFTVIRRDAQRRLVAIPYSEFYRSNLARAERLLREAGDLAQNPTLKDFLHMRSFGLLMIFLLMPMWEWRKVRDGNTGMATKLHCLLA
jgi:hypothetical protein